MPPYRTLLEETLEAWQYTRAGVIDELRVIAPRELAFRATPHSRTVAELVQHIIDSGLLMVGELTRAGGDFRRKSYSALLREHARGISRKKKTKEQLLAALRATHREGERRFRQAGELHLLQHIRRFDGLLGTRLAWLNHGIAHEEYHRGQLALYARLLGRVPALTQAIYGS